MGVCCVRVKNNVVSDCGVVYTLGEEVSVVFLVSVIVVFLSAVVRV